jgi:hypothetical protein
VYCWQHAHRFFHLEVHPNLWGCNVLSNSSFGGTKKMNYIFSTQGLCTMLFFVNITQSWRKLFFSVWHWVRQEVGFCLTHGLCVCPTIFCNIVYNLSNFFFFYTELNARLPIVMIIKQLIKCFSVYIFLSKKIRQIWPTIRI